MSAPAARFGCAIAIMSKPRRLSSQSFVFGASVAALIATFLIHQFNTGYAVSAYILVSAIITLAACAALKDYSRADISDDATYARAKVRA